MQYYSYINHFDSELQTWPATDSTYSTQSNWAGSSKAQPVAANSYWAESPFNSTSNWRNDKDMWCQENWYQGSEGCSAGKENKNSIQCAGAAGCKRGRQRRKPHTASQCKRHCEVRTYKRPAPPPSPPPSPPPCNKPAPSAPPAPAPERDPIKPVATADAAPPLLPEHLSLLAPFLSSNADSGSWRATCRDAKDALLPSGPYAAMLSPAGQAALVGLEKRKKLQNILLSAKKLVSGLNFR